MTQIKVSYVISKDKKPALTNDFELVVQNHGTDKQKSANFSLTYDTTAPTVTVDKVNAYNNKAVTTKWTAQDNDAVKSFEIVGTRTVCSYNKTTGRVDTKEYDIDIPLKGTVLSHTFSQEGKYAISVKAFDIAGNEKDQQRNQIRYRSGAASCRVYGNCSDSCIER